MSRYTAADEEAIRTADQVRDWKASGLIDVNRAAVLEQELLTDFRRTHRALRAVLFLFSAVVIQAAVGLVAVIVTPDEEAVVATLALIAGLASIALADVLIARFRFYRFGVEEACVVCGVALLAGGVTLFASVAGVRGDTLPLIACAAIALIAAAAYWRFGLLYCAVAAVAAAALAPFFLELPEMHGRVLAAAVLLAIHAGSGVLRRPVGEDYPGDDYGANRSDSPGLGRTRRSTSNSRNWVPANGSMFHRDSSGSRTSRSGFCRSLACIEASSRSITG
jgi:hypothetical protein